MKRFVALILLLCMVCTAIPALADTGYIGSMEVVNCSEWVSLREAPSVSARRLVKVSLGAIVNNCKPFSDNWIYAETMVMPAISSHSIWNPARTGSPSMPC